MSEATGLSSYFVTDHVCSTQDDTTATIWELRLRLLQLPNFFGLIANKTCEHIRSHNALFWKVSSCLLSLPVSIGGLGKLVLVFFDLDILGPDF